jgi:hypothetical protein
LIPRDADKSLFFATHIDGLKLQWIDNKHLEILCACGNGRIWAQAKAWNDINIQVKQTGSRNAAPITFLLENPHMAMTRRIRQ